MIRVTYMGTPEYAVPALRALAENKLTEIALVVTQPDRQQGRGRKWQSPAVKLAADELGIPVLQVSSLRDPDARSRLEASRPDLIIVAAFGLILGPKTLNLPRLGCINLHASILPMYRGANPIAAAIAMGETGTGVTLMHMDRGLDTGDIIGVTETAIGPSDTTASLTRRLAQSGATLLGEYLPMLANGSAPRSPQGTPATLTRPMVKGDGWIDWHASADTIEAHVRAMIPWPGAWTSGQDMDRLLIHSVGITDAGTTLAPGQVFVGDRRVVVGTSASPVHIVAAQFPGGRPVEGQPLVDRFRAFHEQMLGTGERPSVPGPLVRSLSG